MAMSQAINIKGHTQSGSGAESTVIVNGVGTADRAKVVALSLVAPSIFDTASGVALLVSAQKTSVEHLGNDVYSVRVVYEPPGKSKASNRLQRTYSSADESAKIYTPLAVTRQENTTGVTAPHQTIGPENEGADVQRGYGMTTFSMLVPAANITDAATNDMLMAWLHKVNDGAFLGLATGGVKFSGYDVQPQDGGNYLVKLVFALRDSSFEDLGGDVPILLKDGWDIADPKYGSAYVAGSGVGGAGRGQMVPVSAASLQVYHRADLNDLLAYWQALAVEGGE